ncbi:MAG: hypothetical protein HY902_17025 [Deltaproteobacteria bacterium]|nr:hypothetical protein [Deltaproteobacteria bacterium]
MSACLAVAGCKGKAPETPAAPAPAAKAEEPAKELAKAVEPAAAAPAAPAAPAASNNPAVAELAPLWPDIAKCEDTSDLYAKDKCPANFKLLETTKAAYEGREKDPARFSQVYEAIVDQIIHGTDLKARNCAAYAAWSKGYRGGKAFEDNNKLAMDLLDALKKLDKDDNYVGYGIANVLGGRWSKDDDVRKAMVAATKDKTIKSLGGRRELIRHAGWVAKDVADIYSGIRGVAMDASDAEEVRSEAISSLAGLARDKPEVIDVLIGMVDDPVLAVARGAVMGLGSAKAATPEAKKAQDKLVELLTGGATKVPLSSLGSALGRIADLDGIGAVAKYFAANGDKPGVVNAYMEVIYGACTSGRFKDNADADKALRAGADAILKAKAATASDRRYALTSLGALGGPKSVAACKKLTGDAEASVAEAANKCIEKASAAPK